MLIIIKITGFRKIRGKEKTQPATRKGIFVIFQKLI